MAIIFSNGFGIGASNNGGGGSLSFFTDLGAITSYLRNYMSDFQNPDFYSYLLDGDGFHIYDGDNDMYDRGNATSPWLRSNVAQTGTTSYDGPSDYPYAIDYTTTGSTGTMDTTFGYLSLGYNSPNLLPLTVIGTRATIANPGDPIGFQVGGNIGADGSGIHVDGNIYTGDIVSGFTVHAFYSETYDAGDPSVCDVFILLGHPSWNSVFGNVYYGADNSNDGNSSFLYTSGNGATNILAIKTLLSKYNGSSEITFSEVQTVVDNFIMRIGESMSNSLTPTPTITPTTTPTPTPAPLSQYTPNGTTGGNGLITYLNYVNGVDSGNNLLLPDSSGFNDPYVWTGTNPYTIGATGYTFNDGTSFAYATDTTNYNTGFSSMTFEMWVKFPSISSSMSLIAAGTNLGGWALRVDGNGTQLNLVKYNIADQTINLPYTLQSNTWYHIVAAQGGTSLTYFINGEIVGAVNTGASNNFSFPNGTVNIAKDYYTNTNTSLTFGILKVYDYCLTTSDVTTEFNNTKTDYGFIISTPTPTPTPTITPTITVTPTITPSVTSYTYTLQCSSTGIQNGMVFMFSDSNPSNTITYNPNDIIPSGFLGFTAVDDLGNDRTSFYSPLTGSTTLTLNQGSNTAVFTVTTGAFQYIQVNPGSYMFALADPSKLTQTTTSTGAFTCGQSINIGLPSVSGGGGSNSWYFYSDEGNINANPPLSNGNAIFTINGAQTIETFNPNKVDGVTYLYFNLNDSSGTDYTSQFSGYTGGTGTITISQNGDTATYTSTTPGSFAIQTIGGSSFFMISTGACTQTKTSNAPYVFADPISITFG